MRHFGRGHGMAIGFILLLSVQTMRGQVLDPIFETGLKPYNTYHGGDIDIINVRNGDLMLDIPLVSYPQRGGKLKLDFVLHYWNTGSEVQMVTTCSNAPNQVCVTGPSAVWVTGNPQCSLLSLCHGFAVIDPDQLWLVISASAPYGIPDQTAVYINDSFSLQKADGASLPVYPTAPSVAAPGRTVDGSGYLVSSLNTPYPAITGPDGIVYTGSDGSLGITSTRQDTNGNTIANSPSTGWVDTVGRQIPNPIADTNPSDSAKCSGPPPIDHVTVMDFPGPDGGAYPVLFCYVAMTETDPLQTAFNGYATTYSRSELQSVVLPNSTTWTFQYSPDGYGNLAQVTFPTGGTLSYVWGGAWGGSAPTYMYHPAITSRTLNPNDGVTPPATWNYQYSVYGTTPGSSQTTISSPASIGTTPDDAVHVFNQPTGTHETEARYYQGSSTTGAAPLKTVDTAYTTDLYSGLPLQVTTTLNSGQQATATNTWDWNYYTFYTGGTSSSETFELDDGAMLVTIPSQQVFTGTLGRLLSKQEYDYGASSPSRTTSTTYMWQTNPTYLNANWLTQPGNTATFDGGGNWFAQTNYGYDAHANLTSVTRVGPGNPTTQYSYDPNGMRTKMCAPIDPACANPTLYTYDTVDDLFPTQVQHPTTNGVAHIEKLNYEPTWGLLQTHWDENGQPTTYTYNDPLFRLTAVNSPDGGSAGYAYNDLSVPNPSVTFTRKITSSTPSNTPANTSFVETGIVDGLGRLRHTQTSDPEGTDYVDTTYDGNGRTQTVTNPYRTSSDPTYGVTTTQYDALGRVVQVAPPDGTPPPSNSTPGSCGANNVCTSYSGNATTVTDQAGNWRSSKTDALGRLTEVDEPNPAGGTATTLYQYDPLNNLTCAVQTGASNPGSVSCVTAQASWRPRSFVYNSLSQLTGATNPESGTITYTYDLNGNVLSKTAPQPNATTGSATVTTNYTYDALNRLLQKRYTGISTPAVTYGYDGVAATGCTPPAQQDAYPLPLRTSMCDGSGASSWSHDQMGRMSAESRTIGSVNELTQYNYNLDGSVNSIQYPSGRVVNYAYSAAGRALSVADSATNYVTAAHYTPPGQLAGSAVGASLLTANAYNNRLQPVTLAAATSGASPQLVFSLNYDFNWGAADNGNVRHIVNNRDNTRTQHFTYDSLNRISQAWSTGSGNNTGWGQSFGIDIWGNLNGVSGFSCKATSGSGPTQAANNNNQLTGYGYDIAGNMIQNGNTGYTYDAENRISSTSGSTYTYDGDGQRVEKSNSGTGTLYWTGAKGEVLTESDSAGDASSMVDYIFFNGQRVARVDSAVHYYFSDHLGSTSVITDANGVIQKESDYYPYGGEMTVSGGDSNHYKFTGKERDSESGLDNFGARYDAFTMGRFMTPDPVFISADRVFDPQSLNLYAYVRNNPLSLTDPTGLDFYLACQTSDHSGCGQVDNGSAKGIWVQGQTVNGSF